MSRLSGLVAVVAGASRGIGRAIAERLVEEGARVHAWARNPQPVDALARSSGGRTQSVDLADGDAVWEAAEGVLDSEGPPAVVVACAGAFTLAPLVETSVRDFDRLVGVNLRGTFLLYRSLLPAMLDAGRGDLVTIGSAAGRRAFPGNAAYSASKFGQRGLHEVLVEELRGSPVRCTLVEPAATDTPLWDPFDPDGRPDLPARAEMLHPEDVADAVLFAVNRPAHVRIPLLQIEPG